MKLKCLIYHHASKVGRFLPGEKYEVGDNDGERLIKDFPDRFKQIVPLLIKPKASKRKEK